MRIGSCPTRAKRRDFRPARVTACLVVFIPDQLGYYAHRFDVLKLCLRSLAANTARESYELFVLDNGSCSEVVDYLRARCDDATIDYLLLLNRNIGKLSALDILCRAAPGDVIAYADDDVFFCPGWLDAQLELLDTFPRVGMVSARPVRKQFVYGNKYLPAYLAEFPSMSVRYGHLIPDEWEVEYLGSTGRSISGLASLKQTRTDVLLEYKGFKAYSTAAHFQFLAPKPILLEGLRLGAARVTGSEERRVEESIDEMGYARLSTFERYVRHIGNVVTADLLEEVGSTLPAIEDIAVWTPPGSLLVRLTRPRLVRGALARLNRWSHLLLHHPPP